MIKRWPLLGCLAILACSGSAKNLSVKSDPVSGEQAADSQEPKEKEEIQPSSQANDDGRAQKKQKKTKRKRKKAAGKNTDNHEKPAVVTGPELQRKVNQYAFKMSRVFSRHWIPPKALDDETLDSLRVVVLLRFDGEFKIASYRIRKSSKNEIFDDSIHVALESLMNHREQQPEPSDLIKDTITKFGMNMRINGKDATNDW